MSLLRIFASSIGQKLMMALTGLFLIVFIIAHLLGNLEIFAGQDAMNDYGVWLRSMPKALFLLRAGTIFSFVVHIFLAIKLSVKNKASRITPYNQRTWVSAGPASRTMMWGGLVILTFLIYHLLHFTYGITDPAHFHLVDGHGRHDIYRMVIYGFLNPWVSTAYIIAQLALGFHLSHAIQSTAQTLGLSNPRWSTLVQKSGFLLSVAIAAGFISIPISIFTGFITLPA